jgi:aspartyl-tRNA(Asn)/glutamyl-tRNA(Gln) amidotransferase subunit B
MIGEGVISGKIAKDVLLLLVGEEKGADPRALVEARGLVQVNDMSAIEKAVDEVVAGNAAKAEQARAKPGMLGWFVGQVMKATGGKANPQTVSDLLKAKLGLS